MTAPTFSPPSSASAARSSPVSRCRGRESGRPVEGPLKVLLIADPTESLPQASREVEQLCTLLADVAGMKVTLMGGKIVRKLPLLAAVQEYDIVHFAGHSFYDPTVSQSEWVAVTRRDTDGRGAE